MLRTRSVPPVLLLVSVALLAAGCLLLPNRWFMQPLEADIELGKEVAKSVETQTGIYVDAKLDTYLNRVGKRLLQGIPDRKFDYSFQIIDQIEPNAFAAPGGFIYVSRGLLALSESEAELAGVVGHEIVHVGRRHTAQQLAKQGRPSLITLPGRVVGSVLSKDLGDLLNSPFNTFGMAYMASYSRGHESEADRLGLELSSRAGYDPAALSSILDRIEKQVELYTGEQRRPSFFDTHPSTPKRVSEIAKRVSELDWSPRPGIAEDRDDYLRRLDGLLLGPDPALGLFRGQRFLHPDLDLYLEFPDGWKTMNAPVAAGAVAPDEKSMAYIGIAEKGTDPEVPARAFIRKIQDESDMEPTRRESVSIGSWPGYLVTYADDTGRDPMSLHVLWVASRGTILQMIGVAPESLKETLRTTALSLRPLTDEERSSIREIRLRVVSAREGEDLAALSARTGNVWKLEQAAVANGIAKDASLREGQLVKIAVTQPYKAKKP